MSPIENIVAVLKTLPPDRLAAAREFVEHLHQVSAEERRAILERTAGALTPEEAGEMDRVIDEGCEQVDERGW